MALPARAKKQAETVTTLKATASTTAESKQAASALRAVADDLEVGADLRARANVLASDLAASRTSEDAARREVKMAAASQWSGMNI